MNTNSRTKRNFAAYLLIAVMATAPFIGATAQDDEFGVWTTLEASKKINKKLKLEKPKDLQRNNQSWIFQMKLKKKKQNQIQIRKMLRKV